MAIATTDNGNVALFDSVRMVAFGPIFEDAERAEDFRSYAATQGYTSPLHLAQARPGALDALHTEWMKARLDDDGYLLEARS